ncbi:unnamed protein product [Musa acuminata subsp. malaccensis]|uniref:(wild Malaysian banana) hypothetical protein n=1 Tax=Musa acuminata subsp. malaccensis TaxID=214687 RepID=A0A804HT55_MUSAM|nr:unnamed protein product [Musa acuminata subsp. malaccensis]
MAAKGGGNIGSTSIDGVNLFSLSGQRFVSTWLPPKKLRALRKDKDYPQRVDLIQDLRFETATTKLKVTPDGDYVIASGIYSPQVKMFELRELSLKFVRHLVSESINFQAKALGILLHMMNTGRNRRKRRKRRWRLSKPHILRYFLFFGLLFCCYMST